MSGKTSRQPWVWIYALTAFIMTVAMGVFIWVARESRQEQGTPSMPPSAVREIPAERFQLLARFDPPAYRDKNDKTNPSEFQTAMESYRNRDYSGAIPGLRAASKAHPELVVARFYLAICLLLTNDASGGNQQLRDIIAGGNSSYIEQARFYLAKGLLATGDAIGAQQQLDNVIALHGELEPTARALLAQIKHS